MIWASNDNLSGRDRTGMTKQVWTATKATTRQAWTASMAVTEQVLAASVAASGKFMDSFCCCDMEKEFSTCGAPAPIKVGRKLL